MDDKREKEIKQEIASLKRWVNSQILKIRQRQKEFYVLAEKKEGEDDQIKEIRDIIDNID